MIRRMGVCKDVSKELFETKSVKSLPPLPKIRGPFLFYFNLKLNYKIGVLPNGETHYRKIFQAPNREKNSNFFC